MPLPPVRSWTIEPSFRLLARCDRCHRRRLFAPYFEVYGTVDEDTISELPSLWERARASEGVWWWECYLCLIETLTDHLEKLHVLPKRPTPV